MTPPSKAQITYETLQSIGRSISELSRPKAIGTEFSPLGMMEDEIYVFSGTRREHKGLPPHMWPEVIEVTEALIGTALVVAQTYIGNHGTTKEHEEIRLLANFFKHRDEWGLDWSKPKKGKLGKPTTKESIESLGETAPMTEAKSLGQLLRLAKTVLGQPFTVDVLWQKISDIT